LNSSTNSEQKNRQSYSLKIVHNHVEPNKIGYACEKLGVAVWKLATGVGELKERLADAFIEIAILNEADFPQELREKWKQIYSGLTCGKMQYETRAKNGQLVKEPIGKLYSTLRYMRKNKAQRIAQQICSLEAILSDYVKNVNEI